MKNHMVVVGHYRVGADFQGKNIGKFFQAINDPLLTVLIVFARKFILTTEDRSADAASHAMLIRCTGWVDEIISASCHVIFFSEQRCSQINQWIT